MDKQTQPPMKSGQQPSKGGSQSGQQQAKPNQQQGGQSAPSHDDKSRSGNR